MLQNIRSKESRKLYLKPLAMERSFSICPTFRHRHSSTLRSELVIFSPSM